LAFALGGDSLLGQWMAVGGVMLVAAAWGTGPASVTFLLFLTTLNWLGESATFWAYGLLSLVAMGLVYLRVPETKGKNLEEISRSLAGGK
jgi:hypothetical protein